MIIILFALLSWECSKVPREGNFMSTVMLPETSVGNKLFLFNKGANDSNFFYKLIPLFPF